MSNIVQLSIVIVNFNARDLLRNCLRSIFKETSGISFEVFVIDNASADGSREMLAQEFPEVRAILNSANYGFAAANNQAIKNAKGAFILLLNSDTVILNGAIAKTLTFLEKHPEAAIVGCKLLNSDGTLQPSCRSFPSVWNIFTESFFLYKLFKRRQLFGHYYMSHFDHNTVREVDVVMGAFMMIRREVFDKIGLLDEDYFMYTEETDFCYRAHRAGFKAFFWPEAAIIHIGGGSTTDSRKLFEQLHSTSLLFLKKHFSGIKLWAMIILKSLGIAIRIIAYFWVGILSFNIRMIQKASYYFYSLIYAGTQKVK